MDFEKILQVSETYFKEYFLYLFSFFRQSPEVFEDAIDKPSGKIAIFSTISAAIGVYLSNKYVSNQLLSGSAFVEAIGSEFSYWIAMGAVLYSASWVLDRSTQMADCMSAILRVFPVAYALGGYAAYIYHFVAPVWIAGRGHSIGAYAADVGIQFGVLVLYLPHSIRMKTQLGKLRTAGLSAVVIAAALMVGMFVYVSYAYNLAHAPATTPVARAAATMGTPKP
ncbi:MAG TPA: hypothetical protein VF459_09735 [Caulobacteraceae bacterium]